MSPDADSERAAAGPADPVSEDRPARVAIIGGGCAALTTAFELTRPHHHGKYEVTVYQLGWRLGGKGASGRGPADRVEEHGLHIWLGFYENAFRIMRECYAELGRDPSRDRLADWRDAFYPDPYVAVADRSPAAGWIDWTACFPPVPGLPGDPFTDANPFSLRSYLARSAALLRILFEAVGARARDGAAGAAEPTPGAAAPDADGPGPGAPDADEPGPSPTLADRIVRLVELGQLATVAGLLEAVHLVEMAFDARARQPEGLLLRLLDTVADSARALIHGLTRRSDELRRLWEMADLILAILRGAVRFRLALDPRGLDAIDDYELRDWLRLCGASQDALDSAIVRALYDLAFAYEDGDPARPAIAAGQALRGAFRMFFTYRGGFFWKMRAGMGDVVFAPLYQVLSRRGVRFEFFHRLEQVKLVEPARLAPGERPYVDSLVFDVQAEIAGGGEYQPLIDVRGLPCWPSTPDYDQLVDGDRLRREGRAFESHWDRRAVGSKTLRVSEDFDFVVLGVSVGVIPHVCGDLLARDVRWRDMVTHVKSVATQAFQVWMREDMQALGWADPPVTLSGFVEPFDTWADMRQLIAEESWPQPPGAIAYFCSALPTPEGEPDRDQADYPARARARVRDSAVAFLERDVAHLWPRAVDAGGSFRWQILLTPPEACAGDAADAAGDAGPERFDTQFWTANVNPTDRYVLALPGSIQYRISPLDNTYDNLTICGDWTQCGFNEGCVEAAVMSGRLAAHAIALDPPLEDIVGYDHP
ncbi:NAD(P)-binding protein [Haliangium sp.]|uniref:NAD(P)-binding protein n=1 Tax=Haliangium sp. TaxID=2663208 RepID=UPI003D0F39D5